MKKDLSKYHKGTDGYLYNDFLPRRTREHLPDYW